MSQQLSNHFAHLLHRGVQQDGINSVLRAIRKHLGMDIAYVSHFQGSTKSFDFADAEAPLPFPLGHTVALDHGYCSRVASGELPEVIPDTAMVPLCGAIPETKTLGIGAHLGVPIRLGNGDVHGALCCLSHSPDLSLCQRDIRMMRVFADVLASHIEEGHRNARLRAEKVSKMQRGMEAHSLRISYQPIYCLQNGELAGVECLSRFGADATLTPLQWFQLADEVDLRQDLEIAALRLALAALERLPAPVYLGLNASPQLILSGALASTLEGVDLSRLVLEVTEHSAVDDYQRLSEILQPLRRQGLRLAVDDAGAGYASMRHIVDLLPDIIKLDISLVRGIDQDPGRRALARALIAFSTEVGSSITAEGIETPEELGVLQQLGVHNGQGYLFAQPLSLQAICQLQQQGSLAFQCATKTNG